MPRKRICSCAYAVRRCVCSSSDLSSLCMWKTSFMALSNARCNVEERLAYWLLMCANRTANGRREITHELIAVMLGMRRPG